MTQFAGALGHMNTRSDRFRNSDCRNSCSLGRIQGWVGVGQLHTYLLSTGNDRAMENNMYLPQSVCTIVHTYTM